VILELKRAYKLFFRSELNLSQALERSRVELKPMPDVQHFLSFLEGSERGVVI
jgi:UDP-N-acetylglucosamine acyltransferase